MQLREQMHLLAELKKSGGRSEPATQAMQNDIDRDREKLETARQKVSLAYSEVWEVIVNEVMRDWCHETRTPELYKRLPDEREGA